MKLTFSYKNILPQNYFVRLFFVFLVYLICTTFIRGLFYYVFSTDLPRSTVDLAKAFTLGMRFDLSIFCYIFLLPTLALLALQIIKAKDSVLSWYNKISLIYIWLIVFICFCLMAIDFGFYAYFQDRINILIFGFFEDDTTALVNTLWKNYPAGLILFFTALFAVGLFYFFKLTLTQQVYYPPQRRWYLIVFFTLAIGARGSFGLFPLGEMDTAISSDQFINRLSYNSVASFQRASKNYLKQNQQWNLNLKAFGYASDHLKALADLKARPLSDIEKQNPIGSLWRISPSNDWAQKNKPHVVLIVMEGLGAYWLPMHSPSLDLQGRFAQHVQQDYLFLNFLPGTGSTIGSISSLMVGMPHRPEGPFLTESNLLQVPFDSAPARVFSKQGYQTEFIYGGNVGWRDVDKFAHYQGFAQVTGQSEIEKQLKGKLQTHDWGIYDEDVFAYLQMRLEQATQPHFLLVLTTTNHPPFELPESYVKATQNVPPELRNRMIGDPALNALRLQTYRYSLDQLGAFMQKIKNGPLAKKTIVGATGDHSFYLIDFKQEELLKKWSVPFYLYLPPEARHKVDTHQLGAHHDIPPTLYHLALSQVPYLSFGNSLFDQQRDNEAMHFSRMAVNQEGGVLILSENRTSYLNWAPSAENPFDKLIAGEESVGKTNLARRYKATMGLIDYYFFESKKKGQ